MRQNKETDRAFYEVLRTIAVLAGTLILCIVAGILTSGCTPKVRYIPVESVTSRTDTVYSVKVRVDSVKSVERIYESDNCYDSIVPIVDSLNRVIGWDRYHFRETTKRDSREIERLRSENDSLKAIRNDSVHMRVPYPVERPLSKWEKTKMDFGGMAIGGSITLITVVIALAVWLIKIKRRR